MIKKKKATILGNCQGQAIAFLLKKNKTFSKTFDLLPLKPIHLLKESDSQSFLEMISTLDLFLYQPIGSHYGVFSSSNVIRLLKENSRTISFPVMYFTGYNPETVYMKDFNGKTIQEMGYNDLNIMRMFFDGFSAPRIIDYIQAEDYYSEEFLWKNFDQSIHSLMEREKDLDVKISSFINNQARERRLFFSMNHPTNEVLFEAVGQILSTLSIPFERTTLAGELLGRSRLYIYPSVRKILGLSIIDSIIVDLKAYTLEEYVTRFIKLYEKNFDLLKHNVELNRNENDPIKKKITMKSENFKQLEPQELNNTCILVLGMHRSGTSAISGVLDRLGVDFGSDLMPPQEDNPKGFYEHNTISELNESILNVLGSSWDDPRSLPPQWRLNAHLSLFKTRLKSILLRDFGQSRLWALKDPRISRLLDLWLPLLDELGVNVRILFVLRHPSEVEGSLLVRNHIPSEQASLLWLRYNIEGEMGSRLLPRTIQSYADALSDWRGNFRRISVDLSLEWPRTIESVSAEVDDFLAGSLKHHESAPDIPSSDESHFHRMSRSVYKAIRSIESPQSVLVLEKCDIKLKRLDEWFSGHNIYFGRMKNDFRRELDCERNKLRDAEINLSQTREDLGKTREELGKIREELGKTREELGKTREELGKTREELGKTREELGKTREELDQIPRKMRKVLKPLARFLFYIKTLLTLI